MIEVGLIGFGLGGRCFHAPVIRAVPGLHLAAILQRYRRLSRAGLIQTRESSAASTNFSPSIRSDSIAISTPNQTHFPFAKRCLEAGREVVVDKPFTTTVAEAVELINLAKKLGRVLSVYHNRRFDADFQALRQTVAAGDLGRIIRFESTYDRFRPVSQTRRLARATGPRQRRAVRSRAPLIDQSMTLLGIPQAITADIRIERPAFPPTTLSTFFFTIPEGARALLRATMMSAVPRPRLVVLGEKGSYLKREFDPLEPNLRNGQIPTGASWVVEKEEN